CTGAPIEAHASACATEYTAVTRTVAPHVGRGGEVRDAGRAQPRDVVGRAQGRGEHIGAAARAHLLHPGA
ncbi:hypothetical protein CTI14_52030, partial [Methylobacterium radiotolerans]